MNKCYNKPIMSNMVIVSNRLPVKITRENGEIRLLRSDGGLPTAMSSLELKHQIWVGWPGIASDDLTEAEKNFIVKELKKQYCVPIFLTEKEVAEFYEGYSNDTLWPLMHYFPSYAKHREAYWKAYQSINQRYSEVVRAIADDDATIWIHDYHLMLLPMLLRTHMAGAKIGFFLHIPFPSYEIFRLLPERYSIIEGLLGADLVGFHVYDYARHFIASATRISGALHDASVLEYQNRRTKIDVFPIGIDYKKFRKALGQSNIKESIAHLETRYKGQKLILSVDRLDYTKGIMKRLQAYELFLEKYPGFHERATLVMIASPSRTGVEAYQDLREEIERNVSRINGMYGTTEWAPISYQYQTLGFDALVALNARADVALITPMRDGMNLVSKEYIACKRGRPGVLILSEMAGAADELSEALIVNPNDAVALADAMREALTMPKTEQTRRLKAIQARISDYTVQRWGIDFLDQLEIASSSRNHAYEKRLSNQDVKDLVETFKTSSSRLILLDYDGTLQHFKTSPSPAAARPGKKLKAILRAIAEKPRTRLYIISGRQKDVLDGWFSDVPSIGLIAEHGAYIKDDGAWHKHHEDIAKSKLVDMMHSYARRTPGSLVEEKDFSVVWHYRNVNPELAYIRNGSLEHELREITAGTDLEIRHGHMIIEVKPQNIHKGNAVADLYEKYHAPFIFSAGDDFTDEDMFVQLPQSAYTVKVGPGKTKARYQVSRMERILDIVCQMSGSGDCE